MKIPLIFKLSSEIICIYFIIIYFIYVIFLDLNDNAVTIMTTDNELRYSDESRIPRDSLDPLSQDITFAFKTREMQALLLFVLDHRQNVLQIALSGPSKITLLWNVGYDLKSMEISTGSTGEFECLGEICHCMLVATTIHINSLLTYYCIW